MSPFPVMLQGSIYLKGTQMALKGHLGTQGTWAFELLRRSGTLRALGYSWNLDTCALDHSGIRALGDLRCSKHFI